MVIFYMEIDLYLYSIQFARFWFLLKYKGGILNEPKLRGYCRGLQAATMIGSEWRNASREPI